LGADLRDLRLSTGHSRTVFARLVAPDSATEGSRRNYSASWVQRIEEGRVQVSVVTLVRWARACGRRVQFDFEENL
jgi:hypothetical protein